MPAGTVEFAGAVGTLDEAPMLSDTPELREMPVLKEVEGVGYGYGGYVP